MQGLILTFQFGTLCGRSFSKLAWQFLLCQERVLFLVGQAMYGDTVAVATH